MSWQYQDQLRRRRHKCPLNSPECTELLKKILITKASGEKALFDPNKVESTCIRAGASPELAKKIANQIYSQLHHGMTTKEIYRMVLRLLATQGNIAIKQRYRLKEAIMRMGPAGFSFETYVGQILEQFGYLIKSIRSEMEGRCVKHEIDLVLESHQDRKKWLVECKYHNMSGRYTGLKESLYTHARFLDLSEKVDREMLVCNTKVSSDVITYSKCVGQKILSWRYPIDMGLEKMIELKKLYPITILNLTRSELESFSIKNLMIAKNLLELPVHEIVQKTGISSKRIIALQNLTEQIIA
jgi:hypothetical protein